MIDQHTERETWRYLGYRGTQPDEAMRLRVADMLERLSAASDKREFHRSFALEEAQEGLIRIGGISLRSHALCRNLLGCSEVCVMAATIGFAVDHFLARAQAERKMSEAVIWQAAGAALIEEWCDEVNDRIRAVASGRGFACRPRFSPGYGDLSLASQRDLFRLLPISRTTGVTLTEGLTMLPSKSVTALIGLGPAVDDCGDRGCGACEMRQDCIYRREQSRADPPD